MANSCSIAVPPMSSSYGQSMLTTSSHRVVVAWARCALHAMLRVPWLAFHSMPVEYSIFDSRNSRHRNSKSLGRFHAAHYSTLFGHGGYGWYTENTEGAAETAHGSLLLAY